MQSKLGVSNEFQHCFVRTANTCVLQFNVRRRMNGILTTTFSSYAPRKSMTCTFPSQIDGPRLDLHPSWSKLLAVLDELYDEGAGVPNDCSLCCECGAWHAPLAWASGSSLHGLFLRDREVVRKLAHVSVTLDSHHWSSSLHSATFSFDLFSSWKCMLPASSSPPQAWPCGRLLCLARTFVCWAHWLKFIDGWAIWWFVIVACLVSWVLNVCLGGLCSACLGWHLDETNMAIVGPLNISVSW